MSYEHLPPAKAPRMPTQLEIDNVRKDRILGIAMGDALLWATAWTGLAAGGVYAAANTNRSFQKLAMRTKSIPASIPIMIGLFSFSLTYEHTVTRLQRAPHLSGLGDKDIVDGKISKAPFHHKLANYSYDHPFVVIAGVGAPIAANILRTQLALKHLKLSQRIMHSRVFAQGSVLLLTLGTMAFREWMERHGRFPDEGVIKPLRYVNGVMIR